MALTLVGRLRRRRRDRDAGEHRPAHGDGQAADAGGARRLEGDRVHDPLDDALAGRGVHPGPVHGRHRRPAAARVRGHDRRGDPGLGLRLAQLTPMLCSRFLKPPHASSTAGSTTRSRAVFDAWLRVYDWTLRQTIRFKAATMVVSVAAARRHGLPVHASCRRASSRARTRASCNGQIEAMQGIGFDEMVAHQQRGRGRSWRAIPNVAAFTSNVGGPRRRRTGAAERRPEAARRAHADGRPDHRGAAAEARARPGRPRRPVRTRRRSASAARSRSAQYQFTLQDPDTDELYRVGAELRSERCATCPGLLDVDSATCSSGTRS